MEDKLFVMCQGLCSCSLRADVQGVCMQASVPGTHIDTVNIDNKLSIYFW